jgi:hypothetical protein
MAYSKAKLKSSGDKASPWNRQHMVFKTVSAFYLGFARERVETRGGQNRFLGCSGCFITGPAGDGSLNMFSVSNQYDIQAVATLCFAHIQVAGAGSTVTHSVPKMQPAPGRCAHKNHPIS